MGRLRRSTRIARPPLPARLRTASRPQLALLALVCFAAALGAAQVTRTLHLALVPHSRCEHGELTHPSSELGQASEAHDDAAPVSDVTLQGSHRRDQQHDHCGVIAVEPAATLESQTAPQLAVFSWHIEMATAGPEAAGGIPLLALAPKLSPPVG